MWAIQHLSESEMAQERLRSEVEAVLATGEIQIGGDHLNKMSYIKAIVKEITRFITLQLGFADCIFIHLTVYIHYVQY